MTNPSNRFAVFFVAVIFCPIPSFCAAPYLAREYLLYNTIFGIDTVFRSYHYNSSGIIAAVADSPRINVHGIPTYEARCDSIGRVVEVRTRQNKLDVSEEYPDMTTVYHWLSDSRVAYASRDSTGALLDTGGIRAWGKVRFVRLPQRETQPTIKEQWLITLVCDSAVLYDGSGSLYNTYFWGFDSMGTDTSWHYRQPGGAKRIWIESYTNKYYPNTDLLYKRFPSLESAGSIYMYSFPSSVPAIDKEKYERSPIAAEMKARPFPHAAILANGRRVRLSGNAKTGAFLIPR
jgi:hypothetical protein